MATEQTGEAPPSAGVTPVERSGADATIASVVDASPALAQYGQPADNVSAYEMLVRRIDQEKQARQAAERAEAAAEQAQKDRVAAEKRAAKEAERNARTRRSSLDSLLKSAGTVIGREIARSIFGTRRR